jgi:hypothetical protein
MPFYDILVNRIARIVIGCDVQPPVPPEITTKCKDYYEYYGYFGIRTSGNQVPL